MDEDYLGNLDGSIEIEDAAALTLSKRMNKVQVLRRAKNDNSSKLYFDLHASGWAAAKKSRRPESGSPNLTNDNLISNHALTLRFGGIK
jgi:hypothetical protein